MNATEKKGPALAGKELLRAAVNQIILHPETWKQSSWHCGSTHCIAGWCNELSGLELVEGISPLTEVVGMSDPDAKWLASPQRSLVQIYDFAKIFLAGFDRAGFDRAGFDRAGRDRAGRDRAGRDRDGRDRDGRDRDGFDRDGFDRDGKTLPLL